MKYFPKGILGILGLLAVGLAQGAMAAPVVRYRITPLPGLNLPYSPAFINSRGMVACDDVVWQRGKRWTIHNPLPGAHYHTVEAAGINDAGTVVGSFHGAEELTWLVGFSRAFIWHKGQTTLLPPVGNMMVSAQSVNSTGDVLVSALLDAPNPNDEVNREFLFRAGKYQPFPDNNAERINNRGEFTSNASRKDAKGVWQYRRWLCKKNTRMPITTPSGFDDINSIDGLNNLGIVIGRGDIMRNDFIHQRSFLWHNGKSVELDARAGTDNQAYSLNNRGQVVGSYSTGKAFTQDEIGHAFVWQHGRMTDLNRMLAHKSGWVLYEADAINDRGQIVCWGNKGACLLTPMPHAAKLH